MKLVWLLLLAAVLLALAGCATPERTLSITQWDGPTTHTQALVREIGPQLLWGERCDTLATSSTMVRSEVSKRTMGVVGGAVAGGAIGALAGAPEIGALIGTGAGAIGDALEKGKVK